jgi:Ser/Thr protein kinase RdoA (MazF antagonist)
MQNEFRKRLGDVVPEIFEHGTRCMKHPATGRVVIFTAMDRIDGVLTDLIDQEGGVPFKTLVFFAQEIKKLMRAMRKARLVHGDFGAHNIGYVQLPHDGPEPSYAIRLIDFDTSVLNYESDADGWNLWDVGADRKLRNSRWREALLAAKVPKCLPYENSRGTDEQDVIGTEINKRVDSFKEQAHYKPPRLPGC